MIHILNGDVLLDQLSNLIADPTIVCREALIEGPIQTLNFFDNRAQYFFENFGVDKKEYDAKSKNVLQKLNDLSTEDEVVLWFEFDLFCQCNFWYLVSTLKLLKVHNISWARPIKESWMGFGALNENELLEAFYTRLNLGETEILKLSEMWSAYQNEDHATMSHLAKDLEHIAPILPKVIEAHISKSQKEFLPSIIKAYLEENKESSFSSIFKRFSKDHGIFGYGDTYIKKVYDQVLLDN